MTRAGPTNGMVNLVPHICTMAWQLAFLLSQTVTQTESTKSNPSRSSWKSQLESNRTEPTATDNQLCLGLDDVFIALLLIVLILMTIFGNILVVLSVCLYKRMRTFTNILLTSLATADLLVGLVVMPLALVDLLYDHYWQFSRLLCSIWATTDVLLCTASILNLCVISLDRYMAITSPLKYPRTRSKFMAALLLSSVWILSIVVCSPPWLVPSWGIFNQQVITDSNAFVCVYPVSIPYRIYSALCSFYIPLLIMLSVYFKIFRVASEREKLMRQNLGTCRLSRRIDKQRRRQQLLQPGNHNRCSSAPIARAHCAEPVRLNHSLHMEPDRGTLDRKRPSQLSTVPDEDSLTLTESSTRQLSQSACHSPNHTASAANRESKSLVNLANNQKDSSLKKGSEAQQQGHNGHARITTTASTTSTKLENPDQPHPNLVKKAQKHYNTHGPGKAIRGSKEKIVYMRERKALKTIGIVVLGFIICWMPFFVIYLAEVFTALGSMYSFKLLSEFFLWLGYSNSVLNPIIYTMYNGDFRRCFRDLLGFGSLFVPRIDSHSAWSGPARKVGSLHTRNLRLDTRDGGSGSTRRFTLIALAVPCVLIDSALAAVPFLADFFCWKRDRMVITYYSQCTRLAGSAGVNQIISMVSVCNNVCHSIVDKDVRLNSA